MGDVKLSGSRRFLGELVLSTQGSEDGLIEPDVSVTVIISFDSVKSNTLTQGPGDDTAIGEGRGVMSTSGPKPGDEYAEPGESEPIFCRAADNAERTLELRTGRPAFPEACSRVSSFNGIGLAEVPEMASESDLVRSRRPALNGV